MDSTAAESWQEVSGKMAAKARMEKSQERPGMNDLIQRIVNAVIRQEGKHPDSINPGDLRGAPWLKNPIINLGFWCPKGGRPEGVAGLAHLVALHIAQGNTLKDFIAGHPGVYAGFAPAADHNDPETYTANVMTWAQIPDQNTPLYEYIVGECVPHPTVP